MSEHRLLNLRAQSSIAKLDENIFAWNLRLFPSQFGICVETLGCGSRQIFDLQKTAARASRHGKASRNPPLSLWRRSRTAAVRRQRCVPAPYFSSSSSSSSLHSGRSTKRFWRRILWLVLLPPVFFLWVSFDLVSESHLHAVNGKYPTS